MTDLSFSQPERRSLRTPILVAVAFLALIALAFYLYLPRDTTALSLSKTSAIPTRTNFKSDSTVIQEHPAGQDDLYVLTTLRIENHLHQPITINTMTATLITGDGQETTTSALNQTDLPAVFQAFPQLRPLQAPPLLRETEIQPTQSAQGQVVLHFPITKALWDARKSATLSVQLYNLPPETIEIPKS
jgi:hypothetical protein